MNPPPLTNLKKVSISLPEGLLAEVKGIAEQERRTLSVTIELLLKQAVASQDKRKRPHKRAQEPAQGGPLLALIDGPEEVDDAPSAA